MSKYLTYQIIDLIKILNVGVWPSEEILAFYINLNENLKGQILESNRIIELGAGQSGLIAFMLS